jgi:hypothetical protein
MPKRSKHPLPTGHTCREPSFMIIRKQSQYAKYGLTIGIKKCHTTYGLMKVCNYKLDLCNDHRTCKILTTNRTVEITVKSTCLSAVFPDTKSDLMQSRPLHIDPFEKYIRHMQAIVGCC